MKKTYVPIILIAIIFLILLLHVNYLRFVCDDAFISFRYAKNFVEGHGLVYNLGEKVEGYTNFLWTVLLSLFMKTGLDPVVMSQILGVLFSIATIFLLLRLNRRLYPSGSLFNYLAPLFLACCGAYAAWSTGGLETSFYTFLVLLGSFFLLAGIDQPKYFAFSGITFALVCMTRLDGLIFAGITFLFLFYLVYTARFDGFKRIFVWTICFLVPFLLFFFWRWSYYQELLPNTFYVKTGEGSLFSQGFLYVFEFIKRFWIWLAAIPLLFLGKTTRLHQDLKPIVFYFTSSILVFTSYVTYVGGDFMDMFRFLVPILPFFFFLVQEGFRGMYHHFLSHSDGKHKVLLIVSQTLLVGMIVFFLAYPSRESNRFWSRGQLDSIGALRKMAHEWSQVGKMFKRISEPNETLATTAAGAIPYYSELYVIDQLGLTFPIHSMLKRRQVTKPGHVKRVMDEYILSLRPTYVLEHPVIHDEYIQARGIWRFSDVLIENGYTAMVFPVKMSESETKYLYCLTLKESRLQDSDKSRLKSEEKKNGR